MEYYLLIVLFFAVWVLIVSAWMAYRLGIYDTIRNKSLFEYKSIIERYRDYLIRQEEMPASDAQRMIEELERVIENQHKQD